LACPDFVQQQCSSERPIEYPDAPFDSPVEGAFLTPEQFAFDQRLGLAAPLTATKGSVLRRPARTSFSPMIKTLAFVGATYDQMWSSALRTCSE